MIVETLYTVTALAGLKYAAWSGISKIRSASAVEKANKTVDQYEELHTPQERKDELKREREERSEYQQRLRRMMGF